MVAGHQVGVLPHRSRSAQVLEAGTRLAARRDSAELDFLTSAWHELE